MMGKNQQTGPQEGPHMPFLVQCLPRGRNTLGVSQGSHGENRLCKTLSTSTFVLQALRDARQGEGENFASSPNSKSSTNGQRARGWAARPGGRGVLPSLSIPLKKKSGAIFFDVPGASFDWAGRYAPNLDTLLTFSLEKSP